MCSPTTTWFRVPDDACRDTLTCKMVVMLGRPTNVYLLTVLLMVTCALLLSITPAFAAPLLVDAAWLEARLGDANLRIVDMVSEPKAYRRGHIPRAGYLSGRDARGEGRGGGYLAPHPPQAWRPLSLVSR